MPKIKYEDKTFDSQLEIDYFKFKTELKDCELHYHHSYPIELDFMTKGYTIDFIEIYRGKKIIKLVETKGYNQFSFRVDQMIHNGMNKLIKTENGQKFFHKWLIKNNFLGYDDYTVEYRKIKYLKKEGFVDFSFKSPTMKDHWKAKCLAAEATLKLKNQDIKDVNRYFNYLQKDKLTKKQREWFVDYKNRKYKENE